VSERLERDSPPGKMGRPIIPLLTDFFGSTRRRWEKRPRKVGPSRLRAPSRMFAVRLVWVSQSTEAEKLGDFFARIFRSFVLPSGDKKTQRAPFACNLHPPQPTPLISAQPCTESSQLRPFQQ